MSAKKKSTSVDEPVEEDVLLDDEAAVDEVEDLDDEDFDPELDDEDGEAFLEDEELDVPIDETADEVDDEDAALPLTVVAEAEKVEEVDDEDEEDDVLVRVVEDEDEPDAELDALKEGEFICTSCFLVKGPTQLADARKLLCVDCV